MTSSAAFNQGTTRQARRLRDVLEPSEIVYWTGVAVSAATDKLVSAVKFHVRAVRDRGLRRRLRSYLDEAQARKPHGPMTEFEHAREWAREHSPAFYENWNVGYGWADTVEGDRDDERTLVRHWRANH